MLSQVDQEWDEAYYIGEAIEITYRYEYEIMDPQSPPSVTLTRQQHHDRESVWRADTSEEVLVAKHGSGENQVTHMTKRGMQGKRDTQKLIMVTYVNPRFIKTSLLLSRWQCSACQYGTPDSPHTVNPSVRPSEKPSYLRRLSIMVTAPFQSLLSPSNTEPPSSPLTPPPVCILPKLNDDVLYLVADHLPTESLLSFSVAYPRLNHIVADKHMLLQRELRCFFLRTHLRDSILGIGIEHNGRTRTLHSDFDWLSQEAFYQFNVRKSITKRHIHFFLPLAFGDLHFARARQHVWGALQRIDDHIIKTERLPRPPPANPIHHLLVPGPRKEVIQLVRVLFKFMNNVVVALMVSCDDVLASKTKGGNAGILQASEKAIVAYCQLFHLLVSLCDSDPKILASAAESIKAFITDPKARHKDQLPDLGEFIILCSLFLALQPITPLDQTEREPILEWKTHLSGPFLDEAHTRNARWILREAPVLEFYETGASEFRLAQTFHHTRTSLRLIMFQIAFLDLVITVPPGHETNLARRLGRSYGFPERVSASDKSVPEQMVERIKAIYAVQSWSDFFERAQFVEGKEWDSEKISDMLRDCMRESGRRDYHHAAQGKKSNQLRNQRVGKEREWERQTQSAGK